MLIELCGILLCVFHLGSVLSSDLFQLLTYLLQLNAKLIVCQCQFFYFSLKLRLLFVGGVLEYSNGFVEVLLFLSKIMQAIFQLDLSILFDFNHCFGDIQIMLQFRPYQLELTLLG